MVHVQHKAIKRSASPMISWCTNWVLERLEGIAGPLDCGCGRWRLLLQWHATISSAEERWKKGMSTHRVNKRILHPSLGSIFKMRLKDDAHAARH